MNLKWLFPVVIAALLNMSGCRYGVTVESFPPARTPKGVTGNITTGRGRLTAELIEVRDSGIVILSDRKFRLLPFGVIVSSHFEGTNRRYDIKDRRTPKPDALDHLRLISRFPQGLTPELLQRLLNANGQNELAGENR